MSTFFKKQKVWSLVALLAVFAPFTAEAVTLKIASLSPDGSYWMQTLRKAGEEIKQKTDGRVKFKFYPGGVMGDDKAVMRKMRVHQLHGGAFTANAVVPYYRDIQTYNLLDAFQNYDEVSYVRSKMDAKMLKGMEQGGIVALGIAEIGFAYIMSTKPVESIRDVQRSKAWVPDNDSNALEAIKSFGISPIPLPFGDVLLGLQTGMIETVGASPLAAIALQWHTQIKYLIDVPLLYIFGVFAIDQNTFNKIKASDQTIVRDVMGKALADIDRQNRFDNQGAYDALIKSGVKQITPSSEHRRELSEVSHRANLNQIKKNNVSQASYDEFYRYLNEARSR